MEWHVLKLRIVGPFIESRELEVAERSWNRECDQSLKAVPVGLET